MAPFPGEASSPLSHLCSTHLPFELLQSALHGATFEMYPEALVGTKMQQFVPAEAPGHFSKVAPCRPNCNSPKGSNYGCPKVLVKPLKPYMAGYLQNHLCPMASACPTQSGREGMLWSPPHPHQPKNSEWWGAGREPALPLPLPCETLSPLWSEADPNSPGLPERCEKMVLRHREEHAAMGLVNPLKALPCLLITF